MATLPYIKAKNLTLSYPVLQKQVGPPNSAQRVHAEEKLQAGARINETGRIREIRALRGISFALKPGDRLGLVGRNGSGKSTLLRILGGIYEPTGGELEVHGDVGPLFNAGFGQRNNSTGRENIYLRCMLKGMTRQKAMDLIPEIEAFTGLGAFLDMPVRTYSAGMAMRLSFAVATALSPEILLLDEWIGAGDSDFRVKAQERMNQFVGNTGITVLASHNRGLVNEVCTIGMWLDRGEMRALGPIDQVYEAMDNGVTMLPEPEAEPDDEIAPAQDEAPAPALVSAPVEISADAEADAEAVEPDMAAMTAASPNGALLQAADADPMAAWADDEVEAMAASDEDAETESEAGALFASPQEGAALNGAVVLMDEWEAGDNTQLQLRRLETGHAVLAILGAGEDDGAGGLIHFSADLEAGRSYLWRGFIKAVSPQSQNSTRFTFYDGAYHQIAYKLGENWSRFEIEVRPERENCVFFIENFSSGEAVADQRLVMRGARIIPQD